MSRAIILIPARLQASRLPGKPLAEIDGEPMIVHVWRRAVAAAVGPVVVAAADPEIAAAVDRAGGDAVLIAEPCASGSDRIKLALDACDPGGRYETIINLQGDMPLFPPPLIQAALAPLDEVKADIATLAAPLAVEAAGAPGIVKVVATPLPSGRWRALYFTRAPAPWGEGPLHHHIGLYAYRRAALERFVSLPPSPLERREGLEQLRALENGLRIDVGLVDVAPQSVDTPADLQRIRDLSSRQ